MSKKKLQELAKKYLDGIATAGETELLNNWYDTIHDNEQIEIIAGNALETEEQVKQRILENIRGSFDHKRQKDIKAAKQLRLIRKMAIRIAVAAAAIIFIVPAVLWYTTYKTKNDNAANGKRDIITVAKQIMKITLPDGSRVWLNAHTIFKYPNKFTGKLREVELLEGRAFFDVNHENDHPFIVKTKSLNITVLGTSFDVRTYAKEGTTKVSVITGKVGITRPGHAGEPAVMLLPKQQVVLTKINRRLIKEITQEPVVNLWCKDPLVFDQENLDNVFKAIEKKYNTRIEVTDKQLLDERISITLGNQRLDTIMEILSFTKHFNYQVANDSTVVVK